MGVRNHHARDPAEGAAHERRRSHQRHRFQRWKPAGALGGRLPCMVRTIERAPWEEDLDPVEGIAVHEVARA